MAFQGPLRRCRYVVPVLVVPLLLAGCSSGDADRPGAGEESTASSGGTGPDATTSPKGADAGGSSRSPGIVDADPARLPKTRSAALAFIGEVIADPDSFGPGVVKRSPYESGPDAWPVLGADCVWEQRKPAGSVLATLTRSFEVPAAKGKGPVRLAAVVTVHRTREDARWEMAESLEETMRCPTQQLREGELIGSMISGALLQGESTQENSEDALTEFGQFQSAELGGPHHYAWQQAQTLQFTVAVTGKGAKGRTEKEIDSLATEALATMLVRLESAVEKQS
ncbi:hypothetical protein OHA98_11835 [Streptomyces sp. NBC_00654]|uniref:hypothetical protein n=1 Tax=Streptomyces sp. NBC_00654 TaxID=2975799 RepID=UPI00224EECE1|nr:hypothetical protein [Streptomyces sp. NBC_00654]MCX4965514.1 hypothetical protein [Streptomyces sp. NBC_00654]